MAKVLVIGASRGLGLETVRAALRAGHSVRALARSAASIIQDAGLYKVSATRSTATRSGAHSKSSTWLSRRSAPILASRHLRRHTALLRRGPLSRTLEARL
ncbi:MAG: hypothetical protein WBX25_14200 [Rhodomicrobium sp.]